MNRRAKFEAPSFILGGEGEVRKRTNKHTKLQTNSDRYIHAWPVWIINSK